MGRDGEKKTVRQLFLDWWLPFVALVLVVGAGRSFVLWQDRNYGQLTTSLITVLGVVVTLWMTQVRAIEQQEREDKRHHARLTAESQKDRAQRSITQRIDLAEKLVSAVEHLSSENELKQAAGVQEILFQIDDWHTLIESEIAAVKGEGEGVEVKKVKLQQESLRHRQELFDIAYKFDTKNVELLKSRARGLKQRLVREDDHSLIGLDFSGMVIGWPRSAGENNFQIDLKELNAKNFMMSNSRMYYVDLSYARLEWVDLAFAHLEGASLAFARLEGASLTGAHLEGASLTGAHLEGTSLAGAHLEGADLAGAHLEGTSLAFAHLEGADLTFAQIQGVDLRNVVFDQIALLDKNLLDRAEYDNETVFPDWLNPKQYGMQLVDETEDE
ncbi:pentapeptide repeat-containing protein [Corynebacterium durum]|uniref:pentapeptide repeat-containing protein n=1 Tax=Corynebacterium durum TaxID=61592 RepID=UPI0028F0B4C1|nr:pentapeptide repeat-containing protein [Corynebacterium durum]